MVVNDLQNLNLVDVRRTLLAFIVVDKDHAFCFARYRFDKTRSLCLEMVQSKLCFPVYASQTDSFNAQPQLGL